MTAPIAVLLAVAAAAGLLIAVDGSRRHDRHPTARRQVHLDRDTRVRLMAGVVVAVGVQLATGWPVAGLLCGCAVLVLPPLLGGRRQAQAALDRIEAIGTWAEMLRDSLATAAGLEQAIIAAGQAPPPPIAVEVAALAGEVSRHVPLPDALGRFATVIADPIADLVVTQLALAADAQAGRLGAALTELAGVAREHVAMRLDIEADRSGTRTEMRMIIVTSVLLMMGLEVFRRPFLAPYHSLTGQAVLLVVGGLFTAGFAYMARLSRFAQAPRVLADPNGKGR